MSTPPKCSATRSNARRTAAGSATSHSIHSAAQRLGGFGVSDIEQYHLRSGTAHRPGRGKADRPGAAGDDRDLAGERFLGGLAELRLLQGPVFDVEEVGLADRLEAADRLGIGHGLDRRFSNVGGDPRVLGTAPEPEQAEPWYQNDARHRVELAFRHLLARIVAGEICVILGNEFIDGFARRRFEYVELSGLGCRHDQRVVLGADRVVRGGDPGLAVAVELGTVDVIEHRGVRAELEDEPLIGTRPARVGDRADAAQDRRHLCGPGHRGGEGRRGEHRRTATGKPLFGQRDRGDHPLVGLLCGLAKREDAVLQQHEPLDRGVGLEDFGRLLGEL